MKSEEVGAKRETGSTDTRPSGGVICVGGPAITYYLTPTEEELFKKYNPDLQRKSLERRAERQEEFDQFVTKLKEYSKSDKPSTFALCPAISPNLILWSSQLFFRLILGQSS